MGGAELYQLEDRAEQGKREGVGKGQREWRNPQPHPTSPTKGQREHLWDCRRSSYMVPWPDPERRCHVYKVWGLAWNEEPTVGVSSDVVGRELSCWDSLVSCKERLEAGHLCAPGDLVQPGVGEGLNYRHAVRRDGECREEFWGWMDSAGWDNHKWWNMAPRGRGGNGALTTVFCCLAHGRRPNLLAGRE